MIFTRFTAPALNTSDVHVALPWTADAEFASEAVGSPTGRRGRLGAYVINVGIPDTARQKVPFTELITPTSVRRTAAIGLASWLSFGAQVTLLVLMPRY